ncbi:MAG: hypothetical protein V9F02_09975 [Chitinophagaceae bacterium]
MHFGNYIFNNLLADAGRHGLSGRICIANWLFLDVTPNTGSDDFKDSDAKAQQADTPVCIIGVHREY